MMFVALAAIAAIVLCAATQAGVHRSASRQHARERDLLINQIMHLSGRTWQPPPQPEPDVELTPEDERYLTSPSQMPDF